MNRSPKAASSATGASADLLDRRRFPSERRFLGLKRGHLQQAHIGRHHRAGVQQHDVARHQLLCGNAVRAAVAQHARHGRGQLAQGRDRRLGAIFLDEADHGIEHDNHQNHDRVGDIADHPGDHGGSQQHHDHEIGELVEEHAHRPAPPPFDERIRTMLHQARRGLGHGQPVNRIDRQRAQDLSGRARMGRQMVVVGLHSPHR